MVGEHLGRVVPVTTIDSKIFKSKDGLNIIHQTVIESVWPVAYYKELVKGR